MKKTALQAACRYNVGNLHNTGHSTESAPPAAMAEEHELSIRQLSE